MSICSQSSVEPKQYTKKNYKILRQKLKFLGSIHGGVKLYRKTANLNKNHHPVLSVNSSKNFNKIVNIVQ